MAGISSAKLKANKERVLSLWEERCSQEVSSAGQSASLALRDSLPLYLDHLIDSMATNRRMDFRSVFKRDQEGSRIGKMHGADRAGDRNYELTEVIFEYHILREVIFLVLEEEGQIPAVQRDIILDTIEQAVNDAAVEFSEVHKEIQQKFVNTLTHDLKNPIAASKMNAQLILRRSDLPESTLNSARRIVGAQNRLEGMIHDLLDASRIRAGESLSIQFGHCDLDFVVREAVDEMSILYGDRFILNSKEPVVGHWSRDGIRRATENLIDNAVKYGAPGTPITITLKRSKLGVDLTVHNEGVPVPKSEVPRLFEQFRRSKSAQEATKTGWGLGLTLVKGVVDAHHGSVRVESAEGQGTSFILDIPFSKAQISA